MYAQYGDVLSVVRPGIPWTHWGIYVGDGWVLHCEKGGVVGYTTLAEFSAGGVPQVVWRALTPQEAAEAIARAESQLGQPYDVFAGNCEHLVTLAMNGEATSPTVGKLLGLGLVVGVLVAAAR